MSCSVAKAAALQGRSLPSSEHAEQCAECASLRASVPAISASLRDLPWTPPNEVRVQEIRDALLVGAQRPELRSPWRPRLHFAAALAVSCAAGFLLWLFYTSGSTFERARVTAEVGAHFVHTPGSAGHPELVQLEQGTIRLEVSPLVAAERLLVITVDAEIEVRGTAFEVVADRGRLSSVQVFSGRVEVRPRGEDKVLLRPGESWSRHPAQVPEREEPEPPEPQVQPAHAAPSVPRPRAARPSALPEKSRSEDPIPIPKHERAFRDAWSAFAAGDYTLAAELFARAEEAAPSASLGEDACYGRALALEKAERKPEAIAELRRFLERYPAGLRKDEVSLSLGWLLFESGALDAAAPWFEAAKKSPVPRIRRSAERGAEEITRRSKDQKH